MNARAVFPARYETIVSICEFVRVGAEAAGFSEDEQFRVELACDEACANIIDHAYGGENKGKITVRVETVGDRLIITLHDTGRAFKPHLIPKPDRPLQIKTDADLERLQAGGLGLHFMRTIMDDVQFFFDASKGNTLIMEKKKA